MSPARCQLENDVHDAAVTRRWTTELSAHAETCTTCGEILLVATALGAPQPARSTATDPWVLWTCGRQARRIAAEARISTIVIGTQIAVVGAVLAVFLTSVDWPSTWRWVTSLATSPWTAVAAVGVMVGALALTRLEWEAD